MNQILVTQKLYITPELKRKKKIYKFDFILSIFLVIILVSVGIYAEYDRGKSEEVSQDILEDMKISSEQNSDKDDITLAKDDSVLLIVLDDDYEEKENKQEVTEEENTQEEVQEQENNATVTTNGNNTNRSSQTPARKSISGYHYVSVGTINIPKINVNYPILEGETGSTEETDALLKISPCKFWGPNINEVGNYCIVGHNWRNSKFFSKVPKLVVGDTFTISEPNSRTVTYKIYDKYTVEPSNLSCTSQLTGGKREVTLITCTDNSEGRVIIKAREA